MAGTGEELAARRTGELGVPDTALAASPGPANNNSLPSVFQQKLLVLHTLHKYNVQ